MINKLRAIAVFAETARQGSFRKAADVLGLSPSVVSHHISALEKSVGNALIYRSTRKLSLTSEGERLFDHAQKMLNHARAGLDAAVNDQTSRVGKLNITIPSVLAYSELTDRIAQFANEHPLLELSVTCNDARQNLIERNLDLAVRLGDMEDSALISKGIGHIDRKLVCTPEYYAHHVEPKHPNDLSNWIWIRLAMLPAKRVLISPTGKRHTVSYSSRITVDDVGLMTTFCKLGLGLATPADFQVKSELESGSLVEILPNWKVAPLPIHLVWPGNVSANSNARLLIDSLSKH